MNKQTGFCGTILGTRRYADGLYNIKNILESSGCHTLDRNDWRAQKESCNSGTQEEWEAAVSDLFLLNHWSYMQGTDARIRGCIEDLFKDSPQNLMKDNAIDLGLKIGAAILTMMAVMG